MRNLSKLSVVAAICAAFIRSVYGPFEGFAAIEFWLLLFTAAAMNITRAINWLNGIPRKTTQPTKFGRLVAA